MNRSSKRALIAVLLALLLLPGAGRAQLLISGNDEKMGFEPSGATVLHPPGKDTVSIIDIAIRAKPRIIANLPLMNTIAGPPTNLAITPDQHLALVANSLDWVADGQSWKGVARRQALRHRPHRFAAGAHRHLASRQAGLGHGDQPRRHHGARRQRRRRYGVRARHQRQRGQGHGHRRGRRPPARPASAPFAVAIAPDGKRALVAKAAANKVALLAIDGDKVRYADYDMATGLWPYNVQVTPDGKLAIVNNNGGGGQSDGQIDTVAIIDMEADPPRVIDQVVVGDGPRASP